MAASWNQEHGIATATPVDMWPCCQILAEWGFVVGQQEDLSAVALGPFKIAAARNDAAVRDFVEALFPAAPDGTAAITLTARLPAAESLIVTAVDPGQTCQAAFTPDQAQPTLICRTR
jgi:hypothetical protein